MLPWRRRHKQALASRTTLQQALVNVAELQGVDKGRVQPPAPAWEARHYVPFLAQQIAQEAMPEKAPETDQRRGHGLVSDAYVMVSDDATNILGPARPHELVV